MHWSNTHAWYVLTPQAELLALVQTRKEAARIAKLLGPTYLIMPEL